MQSLIDPGRVLDFALGAASDEHSKIALDYFADQVDNRIQNALFAELMGKYVDVSRQLEEKNLALRKHSENLEELVQYKVKEISSLQMATIHALVKASETRDDDTGAHVERTSEYCRLIAQNLSESETRGDVFDDGFTDNITKASPLHDIGKIGVRDAILLKPGRLTDDEFEIMKTHVLIGYETLASVEKMYPGNTFLRMGMEIARYHHEKWDGSGYMQGLNGEDIPLSARIMALADVYDALRSKRVYKKGYSHKAAFEIIVLGRGKHFDPSLVDIFIKENLAFRDIFDRLAQEQQN